MRMRFKNAQHQNRPKSPPWWIAIFILVMGLLVSSILYFLAIEPLSNTMVGTDGFVNHEERVASDAMVQGYILTQELQSEEEIQALRVRVATFEEEIDRLDLRVTVKDLHNDTLLIEHSERFFNVQDNAELEIQLDEPFYSEQGSYRVSITAEELGEGEHIAFWLSPSIEPHASIEGVSQKGGLLLQPIVQADFVVGYFWAVAIFVSVLVALLWFLCFVCRWNVPAIFLVASLGFGIIQLFVYPPFSDADDQTHVPMSYYYAAIIQGQDVEKNDDGSISFPMRYEDEARDEAWQEGVMLEPHLEHYYYTYEHFWDEAQTPERQVIHEDILLGMPYQYYPQAAGLALGQALGLGQIATVYIAQLFSLVVFVLFAYMAVSISPFQTLFALISLSPVILSLAGGFSYDTSIFSLCMLFIAYALHLIYVKPRMEWWNFVLLAVLGLLLAPLKYIYAPVLLLILLIPKNKWWRPIVKPVLCGVVILAGASFMVVYISSLVQSGVLDGPATATIPWGEAYTYAGYLEEPLVALRLLFFSFFQHLDFILISTGQFAYEKLSFWVCMAMNILLLLSVSDKAVGTRCAPKKQHRSIFLVAFFTIYLLVLVAALPWSVVDSYYIFGVQGRYFLPVLVLLVLACQGLWKGRHVSNQGLLFSAGLINAYAAFFMICSGFYRTAT